MFLHVFYTKKINTIQFHTNPLSKSCRAKLPYHSSLQSALGVLGQGADLGKEFGKKKACGGLIYTLAPVVVCTRIVPAPVPARAWWPSVRALTHVRFVVVVCIATPVHARSCIHCRFGTKSPHSIPRVCTFSHQLALAASALCLPVHALSYQPTLDASLPHTSVRALVHPSASIPTNHRPFLPVIAYPISHRPPHLCSNQGCHDNKQTNRSIRSSCPIKILSIHHI